MNNIKTSIVISIAGDYLIQKCINSIDEKYTEIILVLNGASRKFKQFINKVQNNDDRIVLFEIPYKSIGAARELGCQKAHGENIIIMDSDCEFTSGCIKRIITGLEGTNFSKGNLLYRANNWSTRLVAKARETHSSSINNTYTPLLAFRKSVVEKIGGYYFSPVIPWTSDHELSQRIARNQLTTKFVDDAVAYHKSTSIKEDMNSAIRYGMGYNAGVRQGLTRPGLLYGGADSLTRSLSYDLYRLSRLPHYAQRISLNYGRLVATYMVIWMGLFSLGYYLGYFTMKQDNIYK
jgi:glycosyltransferase involved in cell wall biosynthesis